MLVKRVRFAEATDGYGDTIPGTATVSTIPDAWVWPRTSSEDIDGRDATIIGLTLWAPPGYDLKPSDQIEVYGERYRIVGDAGQAAEYESPFTGWNPGSTVPLERVEG